MVGCACFLCVAVALCWLCWLLCRRRRGESDNGGARAATAGLAKESRLLQSAEGGRDCAFVLPWCSARCVWFGEILAAVVECRCLHLLGVVPLTFMVRLYLLSVPIEPIRWTKSVPSVDTKRRLSPPCSCDLSTRVRRCSTSVWSATTTGARTTRRTTA